MKNALILTYYWPPGSGPGVQRWLKFCKHMPAFGWKTEVITVKNGSYPSTDKSLLEDVPQETTVHRTRTIEPFAIYNLLRGKKGNAVEVGMSNLKGNPSLFKRISNYLRANFFIPDARVGWNTYAFPKAMKLIKQNKPDIIITTGPPHSTHLMGAKLHELFGITWVADLRDPWTNIYYNQFLNRTQSTIKKDEQLECETLKKASAIIVATPGLKKEFQERVNNIVFIPNGYDETDFSTAETDQPKKFKLAYVGNFKEVQQCEALWKAISNLKSEPDFEREFQLEITGNIAQPIIDSIEKAGIGNFVTILPFVEHKEAIKRMMNANALLLPIPKSANNKNILTGKIFEYLATQRPILSIGPKVGDAAKMLAECQKEQMFDYDDQEGIQAFLLKELIEFRKKKELKKTGNELFKQYSRKGTTRQLVEYIESLQS